MKTTFMYDHYYRYDELMNCISYWCDKYPHLVSKEVICVTDKNREIVALTLTNKNTGNYLSKSAFYIDANTHAGEVCGSMAAMHALDYLLTNYGSVDKCTQLIDNNTIYIIPRISVDGTEVFLGSAYDLRSVDRDYEKDNAGIVQEDLDNDGVIRMMRIKNKYGSWKKDDTDDCLMCEREPDDMDGEFYDIYIEGLVENYDGLNLFEKKPDWGLDFNRNYPYGWYSEHRQKGAGSYPLSNPENKAVVDFVLAHPNICAVLTNHTSGGVLLYPPGTYSEANGICEDMKIFKTIGKMATKEMDYPCINIYDCFNEDNSIFPSGAFDDWCYQEQGIVAYTMEMWDLSKKVGKPVDWFNKKEASIVEKNEKLKAVMDWCKKEEVEGFKPWVFVNHPELGEVEVGGFNTKFLFENPPAKFLQKEVELATKFVLRYASSLPRIIIDDIKAVKVDKTTYKIDVVVGNIGYLPTYITSQALNVHKDKPINVVIQGAQSCDLKQIKHIDRLSGYALSSPDIDYGRFKSDTRQSTKAKLTWFVKANEGDKLTVIAFNEKSGKDTKEIILC